MIAGLEGGHARAHGIDDAHAFMAQDGAGFARGNVALEDVNVGAANGRRADLDQRVERADIGNPFVVEHDAPRFDKYRRLHHRHGLSPGVPPTFVVLNGCIAQQRGWTRGASLCGAARPGLILVNQSVSNRHRLPARQSA